MQHQEGQAELGADADNNKPCSASFLLNEVTAVTQGLSVRPA